MDSSATDVPPNRSAQMPLIPWLAGAAGILVSFNRRALDFLCAEEDDRSRVYVLALLSGHLFAIIFAAFHVVLKNACNGLWFWSIMGMTNGFIAHRRVSG